MKTRTNNPAIICNTETRKRETYSAAKADAQKRANDSQRDVGLEWLGEGVMAHWHVFGLPNPENRYGFELRCEVVYPIKAAK